MIKVQNIPNEIGEHLLSVAHTSYASIAAGLAKGDVWVDDKDKPSVMVVFSKPVGGYNITGSCAEEHVKDLLSFLKEELFVPVKGCEFSVDDPVLEKKILDHFSDENIKSEVEYFYETMDDKSLGEQTTLPISPEFFEALKSYKNSELLFKKLDNAWPTYDDFFKYSFGFVTVDHKMLTGVVFGSARYNGRINLEIEVHKDYRKNGLATRLAADAVNYGKMQGLKPVWQCVESNIGSQRAAEKNQFTLIKQHKYYWFG